MQIDCGIIGLPNVGKSTLFRILTNTTTAKVANFPFCTIQPNISVMHIPDLRIHQLVNIVTSRKTVYGAVKFIDAAGLIKGAAQGLGMGGQVLNHIRLAKVLCHIVRCFDDNRIIHIFDDVNPCRDVKIVNTELILFDISQCEQSIYALNKRHKVIDENIEQQLYILKKCLDHLYNGILLNKIKFSKTEKINIEKLNLLTIKPIIYVANIDTKSIVSTKNDIYVNKLSIFTSSEKSPLISYCAALSSLHDTNDYVTKTTKQKKDIIYNITYSIFSVLYLGTFFTVNLNMTRAWIYVMGTTALEAAKKVHSDFHKGFIRVQVVKFNDFIMYNGELGVKKAGKIHYAGRDYCVEDGDILKFLFKT